MRYRSLVQQWTFSNTVLQYPLSNTIIKPEAMKITLLLMFAAMFPLQAQPKTQPSEPAKNFDVMHMSRDQYIEWGGLMLKEYDSSKSDFCKASKEVLIGMLGLEKKPETHGIFGSDPLFNRSLLFALVANQNRIALSDSAIEKLKFECALFVRERATNGDQKSLVMVLYASIYSKNEKLKTAAL